MTPVAATLSRNNDVIFLQHTSQLRLSVELAVSLFSLLLHFILRQPLGNTNTSATQRRYGIRQITKSIWSGLTKSEGLGKGLKQRNNVKVVRLRDY